MGRADPARRGDQVDGGAESGISLQPGGHGAWQTYMPFFWQAGGEIVDADNNFTLDSEACVESMTFYDSFFENGLARRRSPTFPSRRQFADGTVGAFISGPWMVGIVTDAGADPETWTVAHQPTETTGTSFVGGSNLAVLEQADNKDAAWAFVEYLSRPEIQVTWYETVSDLPAVQAAWEDRALAGDECSRRSANSSTTPRRRRRSRRGKRSPRRSTARSNR